MGLSVRRGGVAQGPRDSLFQLVFAGLAVGLQLCCDPFLTATGSLAFPLAFLLAWVLFSSPLPTGFLSCVCA